MTIPQAPEMYYYIFNLFKNKTTMKVATVSTLFDKYLGISNEHSAAVFVINVTNGRNLTEYATEFYIDDA
jgi:hypothetical protein